jgi:dihydroorotase
MTPYTKVKNTSFDPHNVSIKWYEDGVTNAAYNCVDRHLPKRANQTAIIFEGDDPSDSRHITYQELHEQVCRFANVLKAHGVKKGDRVTIYLPMIPEAAYAMLAGGLLYREITLAFFWRALVRTGVTTVVDAGCAGWRNFEDFKDKIVDRAKTRILVMLNIVGKGMRSGNIQQDLSDMDGEETAKVALKYPGVIVGIKTAHFNGPEWKPVEQAVIAGTKANIPVMVDFGADRPQRPLYDLLTKKLRPGDIYTHMYSGLRHEQDPVTKGPQKGMIEGRARGVYFDAGTGGGSFKWSLAVPFIQQGFKPDSLSTDLHVDSMNSTTKDMLNVASKFMAMGLPLSEVVAEMTAHPAKEIRREDLGNLSVGSVADVAVLRLEKGKFGFMDMVNTRLDGSQKLVDELTIKDGKIVYDLNGMESLPWTAPQGDISQDKRWTSWPRPKPRPDDGVKLH